MLEMLLPQLLRASVVVFSVCTMLGVGLGHTLGDVFGPMLDARAVLRALIANFVLVPLLAFGLVQVFPMDTAYGIGLMLVATAAGAPLLIKLTATAGGNVPLSASLTMLLLPVTVLYMPVVVPLLVPEARVEPAAIAVPLLWTMILPLGLGLFLRARREPLARRLRPWMGKLANVALVILLVTTAATNFNGIVRLINSGAILTPLILIVVAFIVGWAFGREHRGGHLVLGFGTGERNNAAALVVATQGLDDPNVVVMVVVASLVQVGILFPVAWILARRGRRRHRLQHGRAVRV